jgi:hypothetical protein
MNDITPLRRKRLLILATGAAWHKRFYSQYYWLVREGLVRWTMGTAWLTEDGEEELTRILDEEMLAQVEGTK